jgi:hypothetical protein
MVLSAKVYIILTALSEVAAMKDRLTTHPFAAHWYDKKNRQHQLILVVYTEHYLGHLIGVEYASHVMVPSANIKEVPWTISNHTNESIRVHGRKWIKSRE